MPDTKSVSRSAFVGGHVAVIVFHLLLAMILVMTQRRSNWWGAKSSHIVYGVAAVLFLVSVLSIIPIAQSTAWDVECC
jgi:hypothetical protein